MTSILSAVAAFLRRLFHIPPSPSPDTTVADNARINTLTEQLSAATDTIVKDKATIATLTTDLATSRTNESDAVTAAQVAQQARSKAENDLAAANATIADLRSQLDALPDPTALGANEDAQAKIIAAASQAPTS